MAKKRKRDSDSVQEVLFDPEARHEYLTGFHKRKLQRAKHAREEADKKAKAEKLEERRKLRAERTQGLKEKIDSVNAQIDRANGRSSPFPVEGDDEARGNSPGGSRYGQDEMQGVRDKAQGEGPGLRMEAEYLDEDRHTTVTVEAVDVTKDGFQGARMVGFESTSDEDGRESHASEPNPAVTISNGRATPGGVQRGKVTKPSKGSVPKAKKKKFRYLSKRENKMERVKIKAKNSAKAKARKG